MDISDAIVLVCVQNLACLANVRRFLDNIRQSELGLEEKLRLVVNRHLAESDLVVEDMRVKRFQLAEELAAKLPVKLLFPLVFFIFPTLLIVILGPAGLSIAQMFGGMLQKALERDPGLSRAAALLGTIENRQGHPDAALAIFDKSLAVAFDPDVENNRGLSLMLLGRSEDAVAAFRKALAAKKTAKIANNLGLALCRLGRFDEAYATFASVGSESAALNNVGVCFMGKLDKPESSIPYLRLSTRIDTLRRDRRFAFMKPRSVRVSLMTVCGTEPTRYCSARAACWVESTQTAATRSGRSMAHRKALPTWPGQ